MNFVFEMSYRIAQHKLFSNFIIAVILFAGILVGVQTYSSLVDAFGPLIVALDWLVLGIFTVEAVIKILANGRKPWRYFLDPWNAFDFAIVAACLMEPILPIDAVFLPALRLARILRVLKLVTAVSDLQVLVGALLKSVPSMGYIGVLLLLLFYIYAVMGVFLYGDNDPIHFGSLQIAMLSLFRVVTLEDWTDVMYINMYGCDQYGYDGNENLCIDPSASMIGAPFFFISFVLIGTMIVLNLFIGVIMNSMDEMRTEQKIEEVSKRREKDRMTISDDIFLIYEQMKEIKNQLDMVQFRINKMVIEEEKELK